MAALTRQQFQNIQATFPEIPTSVILEKEELLAELLSGRSYISEDEINERFNKMMIQLGNDKLFTIRYITRKYNLSDERESYVEMEPRKKHIMCDSVINALADGHLLSPLLRTGLRRHELDSGKLHKLVKFNRKLYKRWGGLFLKEWIRNVRKRTEMLHKFEERGFSDLLASYSMIAGELRMLVKFSKVIFVNRLNEDGERAAKRVEELYQTLKRLYDRGPNFYKLLFIAANEHENVHKYCSIKIE